jgi:hypothetical protein
MIFCCEAPPRTAIGEYLTRISPDSREKAHAPEFTIRGVGRGSPEKGFRGG